MAKLTRYLQKIFANNSNEVGVFGTGVDKESSKNVETLQSADYENGWSSAIITNKNYPIWQEMDGVQYGFSYQLAYLMQAGIPEWLSTETYYTNSYCRIGSDLYYSLQDDNTNHNPTTATTWWFKFTPANTDLSNLTNGLANTICTTAPTTTSTASSTLPAVVVENYLDGKSWYVKYSDGFIQQGGYKSGTTGTSGTKIVLLEPYGSTDYNILTSTYWTGSGVGLEYINTQFVKSIENDGFTLRNAYGTGIYWQTAGYKS